MSLEIGGCLMSIGISGLFIGPLLYFRVKKREQQLTAGDTDKTEPPKPTFIPFHAVIEKDTYFKDSLSTRQKTYRTLKAGEKVLVENIIERPDLGGSWAWVTTEQDEHGWCLQDTLAKI